MAILTPMFIDLTGTSSPIPLDKKTSLPNRRPNVFSPEEKKGTSSPIPSGKKTPLLNLGPSIFSPEENKEDICSTNNPSVGKSIEGVRWAMRNQRSAKFMGQRPSRLLKTRTPVTELEIIKRRRHTGPGFYHTLLKPGCDTIRYQSLKSVPTPDIFKGQRFSPNRDIAIGDIDYSNKRAVKPDPDTPSSIEDGFADDEIETMPVPVQAVSNISVSSGDSEMNEFEADISDVNISLRPEPGTPQNPDNLGSTDTESINTSPEGLSEPYVEPGPPSGSAMWDFDNCCNGTFPPCSPVNGIYQHDISEKLRKELLDLREQAMGFKKDMQKLKSRVQFLETKGNKKKSKKLKKNRKLLLKAEDTHIAHVIQHVNHLIELRGFMEKLKKTGLENTKDGRSPPSQLASTEFKYAIKPKHVS